MSWSNIRAGVKEHLESIDSVGKVNDYRRHHIDWALIARDFVEDNKINAWIISWANSTGEEIATGSIVNKRLHTVKLFGLYSLKDSAESGKVFEDIVDEVIDEFDKSKFLTLAGVNVANLESPANLVNLDEFMFSGVLCHRADMDLSFFERRAYA